MAKSPSVVQKVFSEEYMPAPRLEALLAETRHIRRYQFLRMGQYGGIAAVIAFMTFFSLDLYHRNNITNAVVGDIAISHRSNLNPDVTARSYDELSAQMARVNFPIKPKNEPMDHFYTPQSARYGTLYGSLAAQVSLAHKMPCNHNKATLYASRLTPELNEMKTAFYRKDGVIIKVWKQDDMFYAIAKTTNSQ